VILAADGPLIALNNNKNKKTKTFCVAFWRQVSPMQQRIGIGF
jgi:hypothetical protein